MSRASELAVAFKDRMIVAPVLQQVHAAGLKGRKAGDGFYAYAGKKESVNRRVETLITAPRKEMSADAIQRRLMDVMVAEAKLCMKERVVEREDDIDVALIFGLGFPPFRGGLVMWARDAGLW